VDVSSGVERQPGIKDHDKISALCAAVVDHDRQLLDGSHG
jgi:phosphoribosylanthranilate isomerase